MLAGMDMTSMNVSLPENLRKYVETKVREGGYGSASEFIRELIRAAKSQETKEAELRSLVELGLEQLRRGESVDLSETELPKFFEAMKKRARARLPREGRGRA
jgi:antitoxin ParD1/3/4